ncbi:MAG TPA: DUF3368 domain-containing protein [Cyanobacteria bacterium UBA11162]|nr:DUF3368 domain-containing protein [Cyanobacteria bacterium UBA11162]
MIVVCNTSPITNLAAVKQLDLLQQLYGYVVIPEAVYGELVGFGDQIPGSQEVQTLSWIERQQVTNIALVLAFQEDLDPGEAEAIALAIELGADLLLLDELQGRQVATRFGLKIQGVLGVLVAAKARGLISQVKPVLDELVSRAGFWVAEGLYDRILQMAGE